MQTTPKQPITISDLVSFVLANRNKLCFVGWKAANIVQEFTRGFATREASFAHKDGQLTGVCLVRKDENLRIIFVRDLLVKRGEKGIVTAFVNYFCAIYPPHEGWKIQRHKRGSTRRFLNTAKFTKLIQQQGI